MESVIPGLIHVLCVLLILGILAIFLRLCFKDAQRRGKPPLLVCLVVLCTFPLGLLLWLLFRPDAVAGSSPKRFRMEDYRVQ